MKESRKSQTDRFCRCIKKVRKTIRVRRGTPNTNQGREGAAIGICVKSVLQRKLKPTGRTLRKFSCKKHRVVTQPELD